MLSKQTIVVQFIDTTFKKIFTQKQLKNIVQQAIQQPATITLRFVDSAEAQALNKQYRGKDYPTNVLTFTYGDQSPQHTLQQEVIEADIVLCVDVLKREAIEQKKSLTAHVTHMIVHGALHAQGYDHETESDALEMETLETDILQLLGVDNPYTF